MSERERSRRSHPQLGSYYVPLPDNTRPFGFQANNLPLWHGDSDQISRREIDEVLANQATQSPTPESPVVPGEVAAETYDSAPAIEAARIQVEESFVESL